MTNIDDVTNMLALLFLDDINDDDEAVVDQKFEAVIEETRTKHDAALNIVKIFKSFIDLGFGKSGSVNVGNGGKIYETVRKSLIKEGVGEDLPKLRQWLTKPVRQLPEYNVQDGAATGKGSNKDNFCECLLAIHGRIHCIIGMILALQKKAP